MDQYTRSQVMEAVQWKGSDTFLDPGTSQQDFRDWGINLVPTVDFFKNESVQALDVEKTSRGTTFTIDKFEWIVKRSNGTFFTVKPGRFDADFVAV